MGTNPQSFPQNLGIDFAKEATTTLTEQRFALSRPLSEVYMAVRRGEHFTTEEAIVLRDHFTLLADNAAPLGELFHLMVHEASLRAAELSSCIKHRERAVANGQIERGPLNEGSGQ